jgi:hypothetical protein
LNIIQDAAYMCSPCGPAQVAEDNRINQKVLRMMLQDTCAELIVVSDGQQAVETFQTVCTKAVQASPSTTCSSSAGGQRVLSVVI